MSLTKEEAQFRVSYKPTTSLCFLCAESYPLAGALQCVCKFGSAFSFYFVTHNNTQCCLLAFVDTAMMNTRTAPV